MINGRLREAMSDMAETIRRVFQAPPTTPVSMAIQPPACAAIPLLEPVSLQPSFGFRPALRTASLFACVPPVTAPMLLTATVQGEPGWGAWSAGATVCQLPMFRAERCQRLLVPPLPRRASTRRASLEALTTRSRSGWSVSPRPPVRAFRPQLADPRAHAALDQVLALPVAVTGEDLKKVPRGLWMRYTLQLVRSTGQNIRNLEVLGLYHIPSKGTRQVRHDPATGRLLVNLGPEAVGAKRAPFILARQKDDHSVVCCFVEES